MFQTKVVEDLKTYVLRPVTFFPPENHAVYETMCKNIVELGRPQMAVWFMRIACWVPEALRICITFPQQQWLHERASLLRLYVHCLSCY